MQQHIKHHSNGYFTESVEGRTDLLYTVPDSVGLHKKIRMNPQPEFFKDVIRKFNDLCGNRNLAMIKEMNFLNGQ